MIGIIAWKQYEITEDSEERNVMNAWNRWKHSFLSTTPSNIIYQTNTLQFCAICNR